MQPSVPYLCGIIKQVFTKVNTLITAATKKKKNRTKCQILRTNNCNKARTRYNSYGGGDLSKRTVTTNTKYFTEGLELRDMGSFSLNSI